MAWRLSRANGCPMCSIASAWSAAFDATLFQLSMQLILHMWQKSGPAMCKWNATTHGIDENSNPN